LASQKRRRGIPTTRAFKNERGRRAGAGSDLARKKSTVPGLPDCDAADFNDGGVRPARCEAAISPAATGVSIIKNESGVVI